MPKTLTVGVVIVKDEQVLLVKHDAKAKHKNNIYGLPAGRIKVSETDKQAAVRELAEETGLVTSQDELVDYPNNIYFATIEMKDGPEDFSFHVFKCTNFSGSIKASDETVPEWVSIHELDKYKLLPNLKEIIQAQS